MNDAQDEERELVEFVYSAEGCYPFTLFLPYGEGLLAEFNRLQTWGDLAEWLGMPWEDLQEDLAMYLEGDDEYEDPLTKDTPFDCTGDLESRYVPNPTGDAARTLSDALGALPKDVREHPLTLQTFQPACGAPGSDYEAIEIESEEQLQEFTRLLADRGITHLRFRRDDELVRRICED